MLLGTKGFKKQVSVSEIVDRYGLQPLKQFISTTIEIGQST